jgi:hypothetical protein
MACFTCGENKDTNTISVLLMYKEAFEKTGVVYWFFKEVGTNEIKIMDNEGFTAFKKKNSKAFSKGNFEFSRIDEFRVS